MKNLFLLSGILFAIIISGCGNNHTKPVDKTWSYYYYADPDPAFNRVVVMDPRKMTMVGEVPVPGLSPHSADRAGYTNRMYIRTAGVQSFDVINATKMTYLKTVLLKHKPRAAGSYNKYRNLQLISGKDHPMVSIIDVSMDKVVGTVGPERQPGQEISGNCGGNATGHSNWLDKDHFTLLDRYNDNITVFKVVKNADGTYTFPVTQVLPVPTGVHTIDVDVQDRSLTKTQFFAAIEGSKPKSADKPEGKDVRPQIWELNYDGNGKLIVGKKAFFEGVGSDDKIHHYSISPDGKQIWQPICLSKELFVIDIATMKTVKTYPIGLGGGHVNFSKQLNLAIVTNHFDDAVTIIDMKTDKVWNVKITDAPEEDGLFIQSHLNYVSDDGKFFYIFATHDGVFVEINLEKKEVSRIYETAGTPEQSTS